MRHHLESRLATSVASLPSLPLQQPSSRNNARRVQVVDKTPQAHRLHQHHPRLQTGCWLTSNVKLLTPLKPDSSNHINNIINSNSNSSSSIIVHIRQTWTAAARYNLLPLPKGSIFRADSRSPKVTGMDKTSEKQSHLCVLIHGLWGNPKHLKYLSTSLRKQYSEDDLHILLPKTNSGNFTYDGIEVGGERVTREIEDELERLEKEGVSITKLSVVGYSLGGLVARYAIGLLYHNGVFDRIQPMNFTTFATPHLGARSPITGPHNHIWNILGARTLSMSGRQLFLIDSFRDTERPLLSVLADPESVFIRALSEFKHRSLYSNIVNDRTAVFYTTYISATDPYTDLPKVKINYLDNYSQVLIDASNPVSPVPPPSAPRSWSSSLDLNSYLRRAQIGLLLTVFIPIGSALYLANAAVQSIRSQQRIRLHAAGKAGIVPSAYHIPLMMQSARRTAETVFENMNSAHTQEYLEDSRDDEESDEATSGVVTPLPPPSSASEAPQQTNSTLSTNNMSTSLHSSSAKASKASQGDGHTGHVNQRSSIGGINFPTLALTDEQFGMIDALNSVGWRKYPVHIHEVSHTHAAIIVRTKRESFREGKIVIGHWLENFEL